MSATDQIKAFTEHVKSLTGTFTEGRSSLKNLFIYLRNPLHHNAKFDSEQAALKECGGGGTDKRLVKYKPAIKALVAVWGTNGIYNRNPPLLASIPVPSSSSSSTSSTSSTSSSGNAASYVDKYKAELLACKLWACNDVGTFPQCVNSRLSQSERQRILGAKPEKVTMPILTDGSWKAVALKQVHDAVVQNKSGECTSYAYYAAHILGSPSGPKPRVEVISWEGRGMAKHLFVMVGRKGGTLEGDKLPDPKDWNDDLVIVDCWALTLGHECIYSKSNYCFKNGMMYPSKVQMDSNKASSVGLVINAQGGLKKTGITLK